MIMKKTVIALMAAGAALAAVSCNKAEVTSVPEAEEQAQTLVLDLDIPSPGSPAETKAIKTGWVAGDKLNIWFDHWDPGKNTPDPDLVIQYTVTRDTGGKTTSGWKVKSFKMSDYYNSSSKTYTARTLKESGYMSVMYEGYNDLSSYDSHQWWPPYQWYNLAKLHNNARASNLVVYSEDIPYTYTNNTLKATISGFLYSTKLKVLIKGVTDDMKANPKNYVLQMYYTTSTSPTKNFVTPSGCILVQSNYNYDASINHAYPGFNFSSGIGDDGCQGAVLEGDDLAYYYRGGSINVGANTDFYFTIYKSGTAYKEFNILHALTLSGDSCQSIAIDFSKNFWDAN